MSSEGQTRIQRGINKLEDIWATKSITICVVLGILTGVLHYMGLIINIRTNTANMITFASIVIATMGVFLTLLITLQESPIFIRLRQLFPTIETRIYKSLRSQINYGLIVVIFSIIINSLPAAPYKYLASLGVCLWFIFFWLMTLGSFYSVKLITDLIVRNFNTPPRTPRQ